MAKITLFREVDQACKLPKDDKLSTLYTVLLILPISMLIYAFLVDSPREILEGLNHIRQANNVLVTDYLVVGGVGAAMVNASIIMLLNLLLLYKMQLKPNGIIISALFLLGGFAFMGKNIFNIWGFYIGGYVYSRYHNMPYKNVVVINMLSTALSPLSSLTIQSVENSFMLSILLTALVTGFIGFIMPTVSSRFLQMHMGYNIYNMGVATGFVGMVIYALMRAFGLEVERNSRYLEVHHPEVTVFFVLFSVILVIVGYILNGKTIKGYRNLLKHSGRLVTDLIKQDGFGLSLINMGLLGLMSIAYTYLVGGMLDGPAVAAVLTVMGFGAFGKHLRNTVPIIVGVTLGMTIMSREVSVSVLVISALFGTTLAPVAGQFGIMWGIIAGLLHSAVVLSIGDMHGGLVLYNNGLSGGIVATLLVPMIDAFKREKKNET